MKWVGGYPENYKRNLPYITGLLVLNDVETGIPYAVMDCTWITAIRTAAATALTAQVLANSQSDTVAILGCGVQGRYNLDTLNEVLSLSLVKVFDISDKISRSYQDEMGKKYSVDIQVADSPEQAVKDADIIVTAGPFLMDPKPVIEISWIKPGALVCPLDLDSYVRPEVFLHSNFLCTDDLGQFQHFKKNGLFKSIPDEIPELAQVIAGKIQGRKNQEDIISAINIGIALEDMAVAPLIYEKACEKNKGVWLEL
jgi:ornithine cyclodeaminase/alanine dehydrogenase